MKAREIYYIASSAKLQLILKKVLKQGALKTNFFGAEEKKPAARDTTDYETEDSEIYDKISLYNSDPPMIPKSMAAKPKLEPFSSKSIAPVVCFIK